MPVCRLLFVPGNVANSFLFRMELEIGVWVPGTLVNNVSVHSYCLVSFKLIVLGQGLRKLQGDNGVFVWYSLP